MCKGADFLFSKTGDMIFKISFGIKWRGISHQGYEEQVSNNDRVPGSMWSL